MTNTYPPDSLGQYQDDDGTMPHNVETLGNAVIGHRIVSVDRGVEVEGRWWGRTSATAITLDNGARVFLADNSDCCAHTELSAFLLNPELVDHVITGVATEDGYTKWHIYADLGDVLALDVSWSSGNPFYYAYGFEIGVQDDPNVDVVVWKDR
jgi:hypothetical protein